MCPAARAACLAAIGSLDPPPFNDAQFAVWCRNMSLAVHLPAPIPVSVVNYFPPPERPLPAFITIFVYFMVRTVSP